jgi:recombination DNA repair RAD52 pathway protein
MSNQFTAAPSYRAEAFIPAMFGQAGTPYTEDAAPAGTTDRDPVCAKDFLQDAHEPDRRTPNSVGNDMRRATASTATPAPPAGTSIDAMGDVRKTLSDILDVLVAPAQQQNEARLDEILTLIENHKSEGDRNIDQLTRQFAQLTLKLHEKTKTAIIKLDRRVFECDAIAEKNREELQTMMSTKLIALASATDDKFRSVAGSLDARISMLSTKINGDVNQTIAKLGRAISEVGTSIQERKG